jgi:ADP-heptose:LPS heptosyltransferase
LAAAVGLPGLVLWGPTNATVWRPRSDRFEILHGGDDLGALDVQPVWEELRRRLAEWWQPQPKAT